MVGVRGLEPPTSRPPGERAARLRHTPNYSIALMAVNGRRLRLNEILLM